MALGGSLGGSLSVAAPPSSGYKSGFSPTRTCRWDYWRYSPVSSSGPLSEHLEPLHNQGPSLRAQIGAEGSYVADSQSHLELVRVSQSQLDSARVSKREELPHPIK